MVCRDFILPEPASYVFFYAIFNLRNLLYIIYRHTEKTLSAYKNTAYVLLGGALCKAWQLIFSCFSLCALVKRCFRYEIILQ